MSVRPFHAVALLCLLALNACSSGSDEPAVHPAANSESNDQTQGKQLGSQGLVLGLGKDAASSSPEKGAALGVNAYLWRAALDTLGFMPFASADPFGGVIITDWYSPPTTSGERFKATAYILGQQLRADGIRVSLFRQVQEGGNWVDAPVNPTTSGEIEDKILMRARELRAEASGR